MGQVPASYKVSRAWVAPCHTDQAMEQRDKEGFWSNQHQVIPKVLETSNSIVKPTGLDPPTCKPQVIGLYKADQGDLQGNRLIQPLSLQHMRLYTHPTQYKHLRTQGVGYYAPTAQTCIKCVYVSPSPLLVPRPPHLILPLGQTLRIAGENLQHKPHHCFRPNRISYFMSKLPQTFGSSWMKLETLFSSLCIYIWQNGCTSLICFSDLGLHFP